ncbi:MAG: tetratricopeptide repeat protein [Candidatus Omnitrophica bacterium]|nr:tetratricopeptide repeat protein [Candidatus Omnitrophota bacterium]
MPIDFELERKKLDREITFFHFNRAARKISRCIKLAKKHQDDFFLNYFLAQERMLEEDYVKAIRYFDKALSLRSDDGCTYNDKALCLVELGRHKDGLNCFNQGIIKDDGCPSLYHNKGWLLNSLGRHREAVVCFHKALEIDCQRPEAQYSLADSYLKLGERKKAVYYFRKSLFSLRGKCAYIRQNINKRLKTL